MPTLHMDVEIARQTQQTMSQSYQEMMASLQKIQSVVNNLRGGAWQGNSATEFFSQYDQLYSHLKNLHDELQMLTTRLQNEISEWEAAAARLN